MSKQYYLQSKFNPCLEGAAHWVGMCCAVYGYGPCHTGCVGWCVPCHSSCLTGAAHQALAVPLSVLPQHWLAGTGFRCIWTVLGSPTQPHMWYQCKSHWLVLQQGWTLHKSVAGCGFSVVRLPQLPAKGCSPLSLYPWQAPSFSCGDKTSCVYKSQKFNR